MLEGASVPVPRLTAEVLLGHAMGHDRAYLYAHSDDRLTELAWIHYGRYLNERMSGKPTQYIAHRQEFYGRDFFVDGRVLIPRPETEHLAEAAIEYMRRTNARRVVDIGTGSGAIAVTVAIETGRCVTASDLSIDALEVARRNAAAHGAEVQFFAGDLADALAPESIDLVLSNPPYVPGADAANMQREVRDWEPHIALFASDDGLDIYRRLVPQAHQALRPGGRLMMELGYQSLEGVQALLADRWGEIQVIHDLAGWPRTIAATKQ